MQTPILSGQEVCPPTRTRVDEWHESLRRYEHLVRSLPSMVPRSGRVQKPHKRPWRGFAGTGAPLRRSPDIWNGCQGSSRFNDTKQADVSGAQLRSESLLTFWERWADDRNGSTRLKVLLSHTRFASVATIPLLR
jgi:hypothetical protein